MSFERHHPNRKVERNLAMARDLRSAYLFASLRAISQSIALALGVRRGSHASDSEMQLGTIDQRRA